MVNVAINGFGRIGRMVFRAGFKKFNVVAINDLSDTKTLAHLLKYDSSHGPFMGKVNHTKDSLIINGKKIKVFSQKDPSTLPWKKLKVDVALECTGFFKKPEDAALHLKAGAKKVLLSSAPKCEDNVCLSNVVTLVVGVNDQTYNPKKHTIISNASCTTNCVAPVLKVLNDAIGIKRCYFSTIHAYTSSQKLQDGPQNDLRRARAAAINIIPTTTNSDKATVKALPELAGKIRGLAFRVPILNGSVTDFTIEMEQKVTTEQINKLLKKFANGPLKGILEYTEDEIVSQDIIGNSHSAIVDSNLTNVIDKKIVKLVVWYDNEWGYSNRMIDLIKKIST